MSPKRPRKRFTFAHAGFDRAQVDFGLARAGDAVDDDAAARMGPIGSVDRRNRLLLAADELRAGCRGKRGYRVFGTLGRPPQAASLEDFDGPMLDKGVQRRRHGPVFGGEVGHAQLAGGKSLQDRDLLDRRLARREIGRVRRQPHPAHVDFLGGGLFQTPAVPAVHHTGNTARRREKADARGKGRQVAFGKEGGAGGAVGVEEGPADYPLDRLHLRRDTRQGQLVPREQAGLAFVGLAHLHHETHGPPPAEGHDDGAPHGEVVHAFGHGVGARRRCRPRRRPGWVCPKRCARCS